MDGSVIAWMDAHEVTVTARAGRDEFVEVEVRAKYADGSVGWRCVVYVQQDYTNHNVFDFALSLAFARWTENDLGTAREYKEPIGSYVGIGESYLEWKEKTRKDSPAWGSAEYWATQEANGL